MIPTDLRPGDILLTQCKPKWFPPSVLCFGIRSEQRWISKVEYLGNRRGYPDPAWKDTHVRIALSSRMIFEVTFPHAQIVPVEHALGGSSWVQVRRQVDGNDFTYPDAAIGYLTDGANKMLGMERKWYDPGQLVDDLLNDLFGVPMDQWRRRFDLSVRWKVCSAGVAWLEEYTRRSMMDAVGRSRLGRFPPPEPWPRAFRLPDGANGPPRFLHIERVKPADFHAHPDYRVVEVKE
jgi:hypothetical protein